MATEPRLPFDALDAETAESRAEAQDRESRARAVDPRVNVALEASAGTGKTKVLVDRYVNLLRAGVDPMNVLAITFTRKAAAEMRERVLTTLRAAAERGELAPALWRDLRQRTGDIAISTIDAFCLSLLREFPLEADLPPGFSMADDTDVPRLMGESLDRTLRISRAAARTDPHVGLVFAQLTDRRLRDGLAFLLAHRLAAPEVLARYLHAVPEGLSLDRAAAAAVDALRSAFGAVRGGVARFLDCGPLDPEFALLASDLRPFEDDDAVAGVDATAVHRLFARLRGHVLTEGGQPRKRLKQSRAAFASTADYQAHRQAVEDVAPRVVEAWLSFSRDVNALVARGVWRIYRIAEDEYRRTLEAHAVVDFPDLLLRTLALLRQMEEFSQSRYRLESRYHHLLVDEFQDTSRKQWELVSLLVQSWGEGAGLAHSGPLPPSIFIVGDRKQSIYGFRDADVSVLAEASRYLSTLRPDGDVRRAISRSFRSVPALLAFVNDVCQGFDRAPRRDAFVYEDADRFPVGPIDDPSSPLGLIVDDVLERCAARTAGEIARLIAAGETIRDRHTGVRRAMIPADVAILFRTRDGHREFEEALVRAGVPAFVYKGLGFFDAPEVKDVLSTLAFLAQPASNLRAAAWLRSGVVRISDDGLYACAPDIAAAVWREDDGVPARLSAEDAAALGVARRLAGRWLALVDTLGPAELLDVVLAESAYWLETRGHRQRAARENLKKIRAVVRRAQNRGYATLARVVTHLEHLAVGDEAAAAVDATDAVSLMTIHAAKGLEFPVIFVVNLSRGSGSGRGAIRVAALAGPDEEAVVSVGGFSSEADEDEHARAREETKRLLYVALTRARDRLYLAAVAKDGRLVPARGSLAEVLPSDLQRACEAALAADVVPWTGASGRIHRFHVPREEAWTVAPPRPAAAAGPFEPPAEWAMVRRIGAADVSTTLPAGTTAGPVSDNLVGTLVHRVIQQVGLATGESDAALGARAAALVRPHERLNLDDPGATVSRVVAAFRAVVADPEVQALYQSGQPWHEVPFSLATADAIVRGTIDCVVVVPDGRLVVLEFKTGRPRPEHRLQADRYAEAVARLFPLSPVEVKLVYA